MDFDWTADEKAIKAKVTALFRDADLYELESLETSDVADLKATMLRYLARLADAGYLGLSLAAGKETQIMALVAAQEELAKASSSLFFAVESSARLFGGLLAAFGESEDTKQIISALARGEIIGAVGLSQSEELGTADGAAMVGIADGDTYVVTGRKQYVTNAPIADWLVVFGEAEGRPAFFLVREGQAGLEIGQRLKTLGYHGTTVASVSLRKVRVPRELVLGPFEDLSPVNFILSVQDLILTLASVGLTQRTIAAAKEHAERHLRGGRAVSRFQEVRFKLAEMLTMSQTAQLLAFRAAWLYAAADPEARTVLHCAKVFSSEAAEQVATMGMQIMAGPAYISGNTIEQAYLDAKLAGIAGSTCEVARMAIADDMLKRYRV